MNRNFLQLDSLELYREDHLIFTDISFQIESGDHLVIRGQNGSGKTSLIRTICGLTQADKGKGKGGGRGKPQWVPRPGPPSN